MNHFLATFSNIATAHGLRLRNWSFANSPCLAVYAPDDLYIAAVEFTVDGKAITPTRVTKRDKALLEPVLSAYRVVSETRAA